jgi:hypothetical protein
MKDHDTKDNYLWDRSGEPDTEIQNLEEILGSLRYQPQPLRKPVQVRSAGRRWFASAIAIAAGLAFFALLLSLWFGFHRQTTTALQAKGEKQIDQPPPASAPEPQSPGKQSQQLVAVAPKPNVVGRSYRPRNLPARNPHHIPRTETREPALTAQEMAEKEQVLVALRLVSFKLNVAQRKTQGGSQLNSNRNQHKIG